MSRKARSYALVLFWIVFTLVPTVHAASTRTKFVYVGSSDGIYGYRLSASGSPQPLPGSPFAFHSVRAMTNAGQEYLVVGQAGSSTPSALRVLKIDPTYGSLKVATTVSLEDAPDSVAVAVTPYRSNVYVGTRSGIRVYDLNTSGGLTERAGSPFYNFSSTTGGTVFIDAVAVDPLGQYVFATFKGFHSGSFSAIKRGRNGSPGTMQSQDTEGGESIAVAFNGRVVFNNDVSSGLLAAFTVDSTGALQVLPGGAIFQDFNWITIDPFSRFLMGAGSSGSATVHVYALNPVTGVPTEVSGSPFNTQSGSANGICVDPKGQFVAVTNGSNAVGESSNTLSVFALNAATGALTSVGTPVFAGILPGPVVVVEE